MPGDYLITLFEKVTKIRLHRKKICYKLKELFGKVRNDLLSSYIQQTLTSLIFLIISSINLNLGRKLPFESLSFFFFFFFSQQNNKEDDGIPVS